MNQLGIKWVFELMMARSLLIIIMAWLLAGCSAFGIRSEYEQPPYVVLDTLTDQIEVRRYAQRLSVETTIDIADYNKSRNAAFELLFGYISGNNQTNDGVAMVSPVEVAQTSVEVAMTAPVETSRTKTGGMRMRFFLPAHKCIHLYCLSESKLDFAVLVV